MTREEKVKKVKTNFDNLWEFDLVHFGELLNGIREIRRIKLNDIKADYGFGQGTVNNIEKTGKAHPDSMERYLQALQSPQVNGKPLFLPLAAEDAGILYAIFQDLNDNSQNGKQWAKILQRQEELAAISSFQEVLNNQPQALTDLTNRLKSENRPGHIMDPLGFTHVINGALMRLYGLYPTAPYLNHWYAWHTLATKFHPDSPIRKNHHSLQEFFHHACDQFIKIKQTYPYLFTYQMRLVIAKINQFDALHQSRYTFTQSWLAATSFVTQYEDIPSPRSVYYENQLIQVTAEPAESVLIELGNVAIPFNLTFWAPLDAEAQKVFQSLQPLTKDLYFAAEYDPKDTMHVNNWPEVENNMWEDEE